MQLAPGSKLGPYEIVPPLDAAGHRTSETELSGRTVNYSYDNLYRLTNETIAGEPHAMNGASSYV